MTCGSLCFQLIVFKQGSPRSGHICTVVFSITGWPEISSGNRFHFYVWVQDETSHDIQYADIKLSRHTYIIIEGSLEVKLPTIWTGEKQSRAVARSTFPSPNVQNTPFSDHFWKLRCRKSACCCGAKHISKWRCAKHTSSEPLLEVKMSKKCTPLWREAHFQVTMYKAHHVRATFGGSDVEQVHAVVARSTFRSQNVKHTRGSDHFWRFRCRFASLHYTTLQLQLHYTPLHYITLHYLPLHSATLNHTTFHYTPLHYTTLHWISLHHR